MTAIGIALIGLNLEATELVVFHHQVDDYDTSVDVFPLARISRRTGRRNWKLEERLRCVPPLALFPLPDLLNDERRQHRLLPSALVGACASGQCS